MDSLNFLKSATKPFNVLLACTSSLIPEVTLLELQTEKINLLQQKIKIQMLWYTNNSNQIMK